jgi:DNA-binding CsgD family transcriptional regulator
MSAYPLRFETSERKRLPASTRPAFAGCLLSVRELETIRHLARGLTYADAAREQQCSVSTVRSHLQRAYQRLGVSTIAQALAVCMKVGWLDDVPHDGKVVELADRRVTWAQRLYLEAFDQSLRAGGDADEIERTRVVRDAALTGMFRDAGTKPRPRTATTEPLERLAQTLRKLSDDEDRRVSGQAVDCSSDRPARVLPLRY